jgi:predicted transcriptional regulator
MVELEVTREEAEQAAGAVMRFLAQRGKASIREIVTATGLTEALARAGHALLLGKGLLRVEGKPARASLLITPAELALRSSGVLDRPVDF